MSQLCGSGLSSRSNVTSAAYSGAALASSAPASAVRTAVDFRFIIVSLFQIRFCLVTPSQLVVPAKAGTHGASRDGLWNAASPLARGCQRGELQAEYEQHGRVLGQVLQFRRIGDPADLVAREAGGDSDVLLAVDRISDGMGIDAGADIDAPQLLQRLVVEDDDGAVEQRGHDQAAGGRERACSVRIRHLLALLDLAGGGIEHDEAAQAAAVIGELAAVEPPPYMGGLVARHRRAGLELRDVEEGGPEAVGRRPEIVAARHARTEAARFAGQDLADRIGIGLEVFGRIVVERLASLRVDAPGPGHLRHVGRGLEELPAQAIEAISEAVARGSRHDLAILAVHLRVDEYVAAALVVVHRVIRRVLMVPADLAARRVDRER